MHNLWTKFLAHWTDWEQRGLAYAPWLWLALLIVIISAVGYLIAWWAAVGLMVIILAVGLYICANTEWP